MAGKKEDDIRDTPQYQAIQGDERFRSWLLMQDAAMQIEFTVFDVPELSGIEYTREGLEVAEKELLERFNVNSKPFSEENYKLGMRFVYFIGETFRRAVEGAWVALPPDPPHRPGTKSMIDAEFRSGFYDPQHMIGLALGRRTGTEFTWIFDRAVRAHQEWVDAGRPARGTWPGYK